MGLLVSRFTNNETFSLTRCLLIADRRQPSTFISAVLLIAGTMLRLALPHVNVLSKVDLLAHYGPLPFNFDFFTELSDLTPLVRYVDAPYLSEEELAAADSQAAAAADESEVGSEGESGAHTTTRNQLQSNSKRAKFTKMSEALCDMLSDFSLVSFLPISINDAEVRTYFQRLLITLPVLIDCMCTLADGGTSARADRQSERIQLRGGRVARTAAGSRCIRERTAPDR